VKFDAHYAVTGIDPPDLVYFIRREYPDVVFERRRPAMLTELVSRGFPMRQRRWCCEFLKEGKGVGRKVVTGIRWSESAQRKNRKMTEVCLRNKHIWYVHPILDWTDGDVWEFIRGHNLGDFRTTDREGQETRVHRLPYCSLYDDGWKRL
jgi:phosphoadenosine phosphosulfate reductase